MGAGHFWTRTDDLVRGLRRNGSLPVGVIVLAAFIATVLAFGVVFLRIWIAETDASQREAISVSRVLESRKRQLVLGLERYAASNAAYLNIASTYDEGWIYKRFASEMRDVTDYSLTVLLGPRGDVVFSHSADRYFDGRPPDISGQTIGEAISRIRRNYLDLRPGLAASGNFSAHFSDLSHAGVIDFGDELALVAAHAIVPDPGGIPVEDGAPFILVNVYLLNTTQVSQILGNLSLGNLEVHRAIPAGMNGVLLNDDPEHGAAYLAWSPMSKGISILLASAPFLIVALGVIVLATLFFIRQAANARSRMQEGDSQLHLAMQIARMGGFVIGADNSIAWRDEVRRILDLPGLGHVSTLRSFAETLVAEPDRAGLLAQVDRCRAEGEAIVTEFRVVQDDKPEMILRMQAQARTEPGSDPQIIGVIQDITTFRQMAEKLRQSQKMEAIGNLTGGIAHDFNNLMAVVLGNLELLEPDTRPEQRDRHIRAAIDAIGRASELTRNMLSFARLAPLSPEPLDLNEIVNVTQKWVGRVLPETIDVDLRLAAGLWRTEADRNTVENTLLNLLLNARDAMPSGGKLTIETENVRVDEDDLQASGEDLPPGDYVMLAVTDTGTGIPEDKIDQVFDPFFTTKPPGKGTGLGLSAVQGFMTQSGGAIQLDSEIGKGATFRLYFPARPEHEAPGAPQSRDARPEAEDPSDRVLVEDDEDT